MKIAVLGGSGPTGRKVLELAVIGGLEVRTLVRDPEKLGSVDSRIEVVQGDALKADDVNSAIQDTEAVISCLGADGLGETTIYSESIAHIINGMHTHEVRRLLCIGAVGQDPERSGNIPFFGRLVTNMLLKRVLADMYRMQQIVEKTDLDWTIMWPPRLTDGPLTSEYRLAVNEALPKGRAVSRADVAHFMVNNIGNADYFRKTVAIAY